MGVNKVIYGGDTIVDLTGDSVSPSALLKGVSAHNSAGEVITGEFDPEELTQGFYKHLTKTSQHNLLKITAKSGTQNGISYTVDKAAGTVFIPEGQTYTASSYLDIVIGEVATFDRNEDVILSNMPMIENTGYFVLSSSSLADAIVTTDPYDKTIEAGERVTIKFRLVRDVETPSGGLLFKPMIRYSEDTDSTFAPHAESNLKLTRKVSDIYESNFGAGVNLFELDFVSQTIKGITVTLNKDKTVTINGTATEEINFNLAPFGTLGKRVSYNTDYILSGGASDKCIVATTDNTNASSVFVSDGGEQTANFASTVDLTMLTICVIIKSGYTANNLVLKPMLRKAEITDSTFYPRIKTNQTLTEDVAVLSENAKKNLLDFDAYLANNTDSRTTYTKTGSIYTINNAHLLYYIGKFRFSEKDITITISYDISSTTEDGSTVSTDGITIEFYDSSLNRVDRKYIVRDGVTHHYEYTLSASLFQIAYNSGANITISNFMLRSVGTSPDYVPYMRSNLELTHDTDGVRGVGRNHLLIDKLEADITNVSTATYDITTGKLSIQGNFTSEVSYTVCKNIYVDKTCIFRTNCQIDSDGIYLQNVSGGTWIIDGRTVPGNAYYNLGFYANPERNNSSWYLDLVEPKYADDPTYYPYSENEIEFQEKIRKQVKGHIYNGSGTSLSLNAKNALLSTAKPDYGDANAVIGTFSYGSLAAIFGLRTFDDNYMAGIAISYRLGTTKPSFIAVNGGEFTERQLAYYEEVPAYEEGTWTPTINTVMSQAPFKTASLSPSTKCLYTVIGNTVILRVNIIIYLSKDDTSSIADTVPANIYIEGTPFKPSSTFNLNIMGTIGTTYYDIPCFTHTVVLKPQGILQFNIMQHPTISYTNGSTINFRGNIIYSK